jgi:glycine/D-amino acid oxidase-like deaminating enzyme
VKLDNTIDVIYNRRIFLLPKAEDAAIVGASYEWENLHMQPTEKARQELENKLKKLIQFSYTVTDQQVGIRPATYDRRLYIGLHP